MRSLPVRKYSDVQTLQFRAASSGDADQVAALHADSWRRHYRGAYSDEFLDGDVVTDRALVWTERLTARDPAALTTLAETPERLVGFAHVVLDHDPTWGALLDNLHVAVGQHRLGIGSRLMTRSAAFVLNTRPESGLYLWVLEQNLRAQRFYDALGGEPVEASPVGPVGGVPGRLNGAPVRLRYVWRDLRALAEPSGSGVRE